MRKKYQNLIEKGLLKEEKINFGFVRKILAKSRKDLMSSEILLANKQEENSFELAYESMLSAGRALAFSFGLRPRAQGSHRIIIEFSREVFGEPMKNLMSRFDRMRKKRHYLIYGAGLAISKVEAKNAINSAKEFVSKVEHVIKKRNPQKELFNRAD